MGKNSLRKNLSFDNFLTLANRQPDTNPFRERYYYRLEMTELGKGPHSYPIFHVGSTHIVDFPTYESAEYYMKTHYLPSMSIYRCRITQLPLDIEETGRGAQWLYDGEGNLIDCTIVHKGGSPEETLYFGRELAKQRFIPMDIAELLQGEEVKLVQIASVMRTPYECWNIYRDSRNEYNLDYKADSYGILVDDAGSLEYALATALMKPRFDISTDIYDKLNSRFDAMIMNALKGENPTVSAYSVNNSHYIASCSKNII